jgi:hypothetical protein
MSLITFRGETDLEVARFIEETLTCEGIRAEIRMLAGSQHRFAGYAVFIRQEHAPAAEAVLARVCPA